MTKRRVILQLTMIMLLAFMGGWIYAAYGNEQSPTSPVKVDVFPEGAYLYFEVPAGEANVVLPPSLDPNSISVHPDQGVQITKIEKSMVLLDQWLPEELIALNRQINSKKAQIAEIQSQINTLTQSARILENTILPADTTKSKEILSDLRQERYAIERQLRDFELDLEKQRTSLKSLQDQWNELCPKENFATSINMSSSGKGKIRIRAFSKNAGWQPLYYVNYSSKKGELTLDLKAEITQKTGIPWMGEIKLYSNAAQGDVAMPELPPLVVEFREPVTLKSFPVEAARLTLDAGGARRIESLSGLTYSVKGQVSGIGIPTTLPLERNVEKIDLEIICLPQIDVQAWAVARTKPLGKATLSGKAHVSIDDVPTGTTTIEEKSPGESLVISLGRVPLVMATREALIPAKSEEKPDKGIFVDGYSIRVANGLSSEASITVIDRIPVSTHQDIKVNTITLDPKPVEITQKGLCTWKLKLKRGEEKVISVKYEITYPKDREIVIHPMF